MIVAMELIVTHITHDTSFNFFFVTELSQYVELVFLIFICVEIVNFLSIFCDAVEKTAGRSISLKNTTNKLVRMIPL